MTCCRLWFSSTMTMTCGCPGEVAAGDGAVARADVGLGAGFVVATECRAEEAPAADRSEAPHPALATSSISDMPATEIRIGVRGALASEFMPKAPYRMWTIAPVPASRGRSAPRRAADSCREEVAEAHQATDRAAVHDREVAEAVQEHDLGCVFNGGVGAGRLRVEGHPC